MRGREVDWLVLTAVAVLIGCGLDALKATERTVAGVPLVYRQAAWVGVAVVICGLTLRLPPRLIKAAWFPAWCVTVVALAVVLTQSPINGARSWFRLGPVSVQPSEVAKLVVCLSLANLAGRRRRLSADRFWRMALVVVVPMALTAMQPDVGSAVVLLPMWLGVLFAAGASWRWLMLHVALIAAAAAAAWPMLTPEQKARFAAFLTQRDFGPVPKAEGYQLHQSKRVIIHAGMIGNPAALDVHLPMAHNDFIFALVVGRRGLVGAVAVIVALVTIAVRLMGRALAVRDRVGALMAVGVACWLSAQGLTNLAMTVGLAPITGITLPLVSYGGTSMVAVMAALAVSFRLTGAAARGQVAVPVSRPAWSAA